MAALFHDVGKPKTKAFDEDSGWTFHGHAEVGERMVKRLFRDYKLPMDHRDFVRKMVALHLRPMALVQEEVTDSAIRRLITDASDDLEDLLILCRCDITSKNPGKVTRYLSNYDSLVDKIHEVVEKDRLRDWQPPVTGVDIMEICKIEPGVMVGILKTRIEDAILSGELANDRQAALKYLIEIKDHVIAAGPERKPVSKKHSMKSLPEELKE
jgi:poly(A) polymerase